MIRIPGFPIAPSREWFKTRSGGACGTGCKARPLARACAVARAGLAALGAGGGSSEADVRHAGVSHPGGGGRRLQPPCWMPQIRHNLAGSFLKKIKIKSEASAGRPAWSVGTGGGPEEPQAFFFLRGGGVAMETRAAGERGWGWGWGWRGGGGGARREAAGSWGPGRSAAAAGRRRDPRPGAGSARSGVLRPHAPPPAVSRRLGIFYLKKKKNVVRVLAEAGRQCLRVREPLPGQRAGLGHAPATDPAASGAGGSNPGAANSSANSCG